MAKSGWRIETPRLLIRDFTTDDVSLDFVAGLNDKHHMRFSEQSLVHHTVESQLAYVVGLAESPNFLLAIESAETAQVMGSASVYFEDDRSSADVGIMVLPEPAHSGIGREAWCAVIDKVVQECACVTAGCARENSAMIRLMLASGMSIYDEVVRAFDTVSGRLDAVYLRRNLNESPGMPAVVEIPE